MNTWSVDLVTVSRQTASCAVCGHLEQAHLFEDVPHSLDKRGFCVECDLAPVAGPAASSIDCWHEFIPAQQA